MPFFRVWAAFSATDRHVVQRIAFLSMLAADIKREGGMSTRLTELQARVSWTGQLERTLAAVKTHRPPHLRIRIFGTPSQADRRLLEATKALESEGYDVKALDQKLLSVVFRVVDVHLERAADSPETPPP